MRKVYICSPYGNTEYAKELTRQAVEMGFAPVTPHLYLTKYMDGSRPEERAEGLALLECCDFVVAGTRYGTSVGMRREMQVARTLGIEIVNADRLPHKPEYDIRQKRKAAEDYARRHACSFCRGRYFHTCTSFSCDMPYKKDYEYAEARCSLQGGKWGIR